MRQLLYLTLLATVFFSCTKDFDYKDLFDRDKDNKHTVLCTL
jgi:hypothetical protein